LEALSALMPISAADEGPVEVTVALRADPDGRNLGLTPSKRQVGAPASATLVNGAAAKGLVTSVLRTRWSALTSSAVNVTWTVGAQVDPAALEVATALNPVDFFPVADGSVAGSASVLNSAGKAVLPTVRATAPREIDAVNTILASPQLRETHISALVAVALQPGYSGVDPYGRGSGAKARLHGLHPWLAERLTHPSPANPDRRYSKAGINWDTGAFDWKEIGRAADEIKLAPELDPSIYFRRMEEVVAFLKPNVDLRKVSLVVGRSSKEKASNGLRLMNLREALSIASTLEVRTAAIAPNASVLIVGKNIFQETGERHPLTRPPSRSPFVPRRRRSADGGSRMPSMVQVDARRSGSAECTSTMWRSTRRRRSGSRSTACRRWQREARSTKRRHLGPVAEQVERWSRPKGQRHSKAPTQPGCMTSR
jgi:hypothetical protein